MEGRGEWQGWKKSVRQQWLWEKKMEQRAGKERKGSLRSHMPLTAGSVTTHTQVWGRVLPGVLPAGCPLTLKTWYRNWATSSSSSQELHFLSAIFLTGKRSKWSFKGNECLCQLDIPSASQSFHNSSGSRSRGNTHYADGSQPPTLSKDLLPKERSASNFMETIATTSLLQTASGQCTDIVTKGVTLTPELICYLSRLPF